MYILCSMLDLPGTHVTTRTIGSACPVTYENNEYSHVRSIYSFQGVLECTECI